MKRFPLLISLAAVCLLILSSVATAQQISPNPNPVGNEIEVDTPLRQNGVVFVNYGRIYMNNNGTLTNFSELINYEGAWITNRRGGTLINADGGTLTNNFGLGFSGTFDNTDGTFINNAIFVGDGTFLGQLDDAGVLAPGFPRPGAGVLTLTGDLNKTAGSIEIELGGTVRGNEHDVLVVDGNLSLDGNLDVLAIGGFEPQGGDMFDILDFAPENLIGSFSAVDLPTLASGLTWDSSDLYNRGTLSVIPELAVLKGDVDDDGSVNNLDITPFIAALAAEDEAAFLTQFPNGNYDAADIDMSGIANNLDITPFIGLLTATGATAVPEPGPIACVMLILMMGRRCSVRR